MENYFSKEKIVLEETKNLTNKFRGNLSSNNNILRKPKVVLLRL